MNVDGTGAREVTKEPLRLLSSPAWHPNGQYIAARKHFVGSRALGSGEIWLYHAAGGEGIQLNEKPNWQKDLGEPAFSPDGRYLYYSQDTTPGATFQYNKDANGQIYQVFRRDLLGGKTRPLAGGPGGAVRPVPSPDGKHLAFVRRVRNQSTLFLKDLDTGVETAAWGELERDMQEAWAIHGVYPSFAWLPGGREIVIWARGRIWRLDPFARRAVEIPFHVKDTREVRKAVRFDTAVAPDPVEVKQLRWVNVAPAGDKLVYSALGHIYVRDLPEGTPLRLTTQDGHFEFFPAFSRDGQHVVYTTWHDEKLGSVRMFDLKRGVETVLTADAGRYIEPALSPDGKHVAFVRLSGGFLTTPWNGLDAGVFVAKTNGGGAPVRLAEDGRAPQFGADGQHLYVSRLVRKDDEEWSTHFVRHRLDRTDEQVLAKSEFATEFSLSPNGEWLAFRERFHIHAVPLPLAGKTLTLDPRMKGLPVKQLDAIAGDYMHWSGDSQVVHYALGDELFSSKLADAFPFLPGAPREPVAPPPNGLKIGFSTRADKPAATTVISGARIVTMRGDEVIDQGRIVVRQNRIVAVGREIDIPVPADAHLVDAAGKTIIPGLVDVHWHGRMSDNGIVPQQSWINYASLAFGVTTLHDPFNETAAIYTQSEMQRAGHIVAPRIFSTGTVLYGGKSNIAAVVNGIDEARAHVARVKAGGPVSVKSYSLPRRDQRQQVIEAAREARMMVVPEGGSLFQHNMNMVVDGHTGLEHALPVAHVYDDVVQLWAQTRVGYTPTLVVGYGGLDGEHYWYARTDVWRHPLLSRYVPRSVLEPRAVRRLTAPEEDFNVLRIAAAATRLQRAGVPVNIGGHGQREGLAAHWEMWTLAKGGMTPLEAIRAATLNGANYLGMGRDIGSLEPGKLADLVIIDGDVLQDIRHSDRVSQVMLNGRLYDAVTMNEMGATPKARRPFFFDGVSGRSSAGRVGLLNSDDDGPGAAHVD